MLLERNSTGATLALDAEPSAEIDGVCGTLYPFEQATSEPVNSVPVSTVTDKRIVKLLSLQRGRGDTASAA
jgi:hypothetical protein